jgi:hypothetical protein
MRRIECLFSLSSRLSWVTWGVADDAVLCCAALDCIVS